MKFLCTIIICIAALSTTAQKVSTFKEVLKTATEIPITDSILINYFSLEKISLDTATGESLFKAFYRKETHPLQQAEYFVAGKITLHKDFDILLLSTEYLVTDKYSIGSKVDRSISRELFFVLLDKEGNYKNNFLGAMNYEKSNYFQKTPIRKISSSIYKDFRIIQYVETSPKPSNEIFLSYEQREPRKMNFSMEYHINDYGVFVAYPKFKSN